MATLISNSSNNFTSSSTWALCNSTSSLDSEAANTGLTTSYVASAAFTPGVITIDGIAVKVQSRPGSTGTISIELYNSTAGSSVAGTEVTINISDISDSSGWYLFKFSPVTLLAATNYQVRAKSSNATQVNLYRNATAGNWSRQLRTTTQQAPAAGDTLLIIGEHTGAGTGNSFTVTMNETASTIYGNLTATDAISVGQRGTLSYGTSAGTNYYLKFKGRFTVQGGGTLNIGTTGTPIPGTSTAVLEMDSTVNVDTGLVVMPSGTFIAQGNPITTTKTLLTSSLGGRCTTSSTGNVVVRLEGESFISMSGTINIDGTNFTISSVATDSQLFLTTDPGNKLDVVYKYSPSASTLAVSSTSGWQNGDVICVGSTSRTATDATAVTITSVNSATQVTVTPAVNAHLGLNPMQAEVGLLTRNVKIRGISTSLQGYIETRTTSVVDWDYVEFSKFGSNTSLKRGIDVGTTTGSFTCSYCSIYDCVVANSSGIRINSTSGNSHTIEHCIFYNIASTMLTISTSSVSGHMIDSNYFIGKTTTSGSNGIIIGNSKITFKNNRVSASGTANSISISNNELTIIDNNVIHSGSSVNNALLTISSFSCSASNNSIWRSSGVGLNLQNTANATISGLSAWGSLTSNVSLQSAENFEANEWSINSSDGVSYGLNATTGILLRESCIGQINNSSFGSLGSHSNSDILSDYSSGASSMTGVKQLRLHNTIVASDPDIDMSASINPYSFVSSQRHNQTAGDHRLYRYNGKVSTDHNFYHSSPPSIKMESWTSDALSSGRIDCFFQVPVSNGNSVTFSIKIRKSTLTDTYVINEIEYPGHEYDGSQPCLLVKKQVTAGITADTVLATSVSANGVWETLTGTTAAVTEDCVLQFAVESFYSLGWVNVDEPSARCGVDLSNLAYANDAFPVVVLQTSGIFSGLSSGCTL